ncbi:MAG: MerR family transcriptional regulator [Caldilineales bacterium]|nr:MerR family transcriptional regulator [Caldilineales bacterium]
MDLNKSIWTASDEPIYNIGVVSRMTGIPVATLRVWERRYKFPKATRTAGGHRLYSERELLRLRWVKASIDEGVQTSQAIRALRSRERAGRLTESPPTATAPAEPPGQSTGAAPAPTAPAAAALPQVAPAMGPAVLSPLAAFQQRLVNALVSHDLAQAEQVLGEVLAIYPMEDLILEVIRPALVDIGEGWVAGRINVATEHLASQFIRQRLTLWMISGPPVQAMKPVVLACGPDEWHELNLLMLGVLLRRRRWPVAYLGQSVPLHDLAKFVRDIDPPAVVVAAMTEQSARQLLQWPEWLPEAASTGRPVVAYGGAAFNNHPELRTQMQGLFLGPTLPEGVDALERLLLSVNGR